MPTGSTIAAICTAPGRSARSMIRISGPDVQGCIKEHCGISLGDRGSSKVQFRLSNHRTLAMLLLWYPGPNSYTGEDTVELIYTGNPTLGRRVLDQLVEGVGGGGGIELAGPGEFSARAYLNHRLSLVQAEGIALRISAEHDDALVAAESLLDGSYGKQCEQWAHELTTLLALVEAGVDFSDQEDVVPILPKDLVDRLKVIAKAIEDQLGTQAGDRVRDDLPSVVLVGRPNAGKSSLMNALLGIRRVLVSDRAGTTRDVIKERLDLSRIAPGAGCVELVDLAGIGEESIDAIDAQAQQIARKTIEKASALVWCDPDGRFDAQSLGLPRGVPIVRVQTKSDLPSAGATSDAIGVCALDGTAVDVLARAIADAATQVRGSGVGVFVPRHRRALLDSVYGINEAVARVDILCPIIQDPELVALGLRSALDAMGELVGEVSPDDVLGRVFASFCVGK